MSLKKFYVTTPIYYGTAKPHLGSLYSTLIADVVKRWQTLNGYQTFFLTGTDEHGQKIAQAAHKAGLTPQQFVDSFIDDYKNTWATYEIEYDHFIRTTDAYHKKGVQDVVTKLLNKGDIYKAYYRGWYCVPDESFEMMLETEPEKDAVGPACSSCGRSTVAVSEETYFFRLSAYQEKILAFLKNNPTFITPKERAREVITFVESGLKDLSISRSTISWGIPFPQDPAQIIYVWIDALCNYITGVGYGDVHKRAEFETLWPADLHVLGKDIVRFHAVYWPALLMAAELPLPKRLLVHGWLQVNKQKMSKSFGNVVDPIELTRVYGVEPVRYYLMRKLAVNTDADFSTADIEQCITSDLANDLGNLLNRMVSLVDKFGVHTINSPALWKQPSMALRDNAWNMIEEYQAHMADYEFHLALARLWKFINNANAYFHEQEPWKVAKQDPVYFQEIISATCHSLRMIAVLLWPIMPRKMEQLLESIGHPLDLNNHNIESLELGSWNQTFVLRKIPTLFEKIETMEPSVAEEIIPTISEPEYITIDDAMKVQLRVGTIMQAESVVNSDKLIKLQVDFGLEGKRQILSGIRKWYHPEDLVGKQGLFIFNLKPRKMMGMESQGMMLFAQGDDGKLHVVNPEGIVAPGTRLQ